LSRRELIEVTAFIVTLIGTELYFFYSFLTHGLFVEYGYNLETLPLHYLAILAFMIVVTSLAVALIVYGFIYRSRWTRKFAIFFLAWAILWPIWGIAVWNYVWEQTILILIYILLIAYLLSPYAKEYFIEVFRYGEYTLYKRDVLLKSGKRVVIYFFSKRTPRSGVPSLLPDGFIVEVNPRSGMPYLKKMKKLKKPNIEDVEKKGRRSSNVIYVVSKPRPGHVKGDWAVRSHRKIFSHHRIKLAAIRKARRIAKERGATVMVQRMDGTFSMGFKPRQR
jgi:signal transduction histidine kinase